ncbi:DSBA-like thioredoxin domain protein [compost metagenome]
MNRTLRIEVYFDFICPWCLIGKRQLERALARLHASQPEAAVELDWGGVQLLPDVPAVGLPFAEFYRQRLGSAEAVRLRQAQVQQAAAAAGEALDLAGIRTMPNTADAHRLFERAAALGRPAQRDALLERLFAAYFHHGEDLGDCDTLLAIAEASGFARSTVESCLLGDSSPYQGRYSGAGGLGVPYFVFDGCFALAGAQSDDVLLGAMRRALAQAGSGERQA